MAWPSEFTRLALIRLKKLRRIESWQLATVKPCYDEDLSWTMKITLLRHQGILKNTKTWDQQNHLIIKGFVISELFIMRCHCIQGVWVSFGHPIADFGHPNIHIFVHNAMG